jgi:xanthine dehydrogenase accessory factor
MDSVDLEVLNTARRWRDEGRRAVWVVVTRTWGSAPRPAGATMVIRDDGHVVGSVSGGCIEDDLIRHCAETLNTLKLPSVRQYGVTRDQAARFGLPCGGSLELVLDPLTDTRWLDDTLAGISQHQRLVRTLDLRSGHSQLAPAAPDDDLAFDGDTLRTVHGPLWRLLVVGAGQASHYLAEMAHALDYHVEVCDPRDEYAQEWAVPTATVHRDYPDDFVIRLQPDSHTAVVTLTHDPKLDDAALLEALKSSAFYVGALGSRRNNDGRRERLALFDLTADEIGKLHGPVGLAIGSRTPPEIAVAILAEMTAVRRGAMHRFQRSVVATDEQVGTNGAACRIQP